MKAKRLIGTTLAIAGLLTFAGAGCDTDPTIFVDPAIEDPELTVTGNVLGVALDGSFDLTLHLGSRASGESQVTLTSFTLETQDRTVLIESLPIKAVPSGPVTVEPGGDDVVIAVSIDTGADLLPSELLDQICAGQIVIAGVIDDSLATSATPVVSQPFTAAGCTP